MKNENNNQKVNKSDPIKIIFYVGMALMTIVCLAFVIYSTSEPFKISNYDEIKQVSYTNYKSQKPKNYYVFIYSEDFPREEWYESIVLEYANYVRLHGDMTPIYAMDYSIDGNSSIASDLSVSSTVNTSFPGLILIKDGSVSQKYLTWSKIGNELSTAMEKNK